MYNEKELDIIYDALWTSIDQGIFSEEEEEARKLLVKVEYDKTVAKKMANWNNVEKV